MFRILKRSDQRKVQSPQSSSKVSRTAPAFPSFWAIFRQVKARDFTSIPIPKLASCSPVRRQWSSLWRSSLPAPATSS